MWQVVLAIPNLRNLRKLSPLIQCVECDECDFTFTFKICELGIPVIVVLHFSFNKDHKRRREYGSIPLVGSSKMTTLHVKVTINTCLNIKSDLFTVCTRSLSQGPR